MKKKLKLIPLTLCAGLLLSGCSAASESTEQAVYAETTEPSGETTTAELEPVTAQVFAMDTYMELTAYGETAQTGLDAAAARLYELDALLSATDAESEVYALNQGEGEPIAVSPVTCELISFAQALGQETENALDISIYPVVQAWGFPTREYRVPEQAELDGLLALVDQRRIQVDETAGTVTLPAGMEIDLGALAKGYAGDAAADILSQAGVTSALINLGSSTIRALGTKPDGSQWRIAIQDPEDETAYVGVLEITDCVVDTSGGYERYFTGEDGSVYWHILNPATGYPADSGLISATIVSADGMLGDALSTATFVMGAEATAEYWRTRGDFEFLLVDSEHHIWISQGLETQFTPLGAYADAVVTVVTP